MYSIIECSIPLSYAMRPRDTYLQYECTIEIKCLRDNEWYIMMLHPLDLGNYFSELLPHRPWKKDYDASGIEVLEKSMYIFLENMAALYVEVSEATA